jgi:tetratricopeptide (TPR) repeat protein
MKTVWPDTFVEEGNVSRTIFMLRKALGETEQERYIVTVPGQGYRLVENVHLVAEQELSVVATSNSTVQVDVEETTPWRWIALTLVLLLLGGASFWMVHRRGADSRRAVLGERDTVVLADFVNSTGDAVFDETLRQGLTIELGQSPFLSLVSDERIHQMMGLMGQPPDARLTPEIARQVCERTGSSAVLEGSIAPLGNQYVLGLRAKNCRTGDVLDEEQVQAAKKEDVLNALGQISGRFRNRVGESLTTIQQHNTPLADATTSSLEALKAYSTAWKVLVTTGPAAAVPLYQRSIEIDPQFAMAYAMLGLVYGSLGESALSAENTSKAWKLRNRSNGWERFFIDGTYDMQVTGNLQKAQQTIETWGKAYPRDPKPDGLLSGIIYPVQGRYDLAIQKAKESIIADPDFVFGYNILALEEMAIGDVEAAERALNDADARKLEIPDLFIDRYQIAFLRNDQGGMDRVAARTPRESGAEDWMAHMQSTVLAYFGHLEQATSMSQRAIELALHDRPERAALFQSAKAIREAFVGDESAAARDAEAALELSRGVDIQYGAAFALARAGHLPQAGSLAEDLERRFPENTAVKFIYVPEILAQISLHEHEPARAIELLKTTVPYEQGQPPSCSFGFYGMFYPAYLRGEAYLAEHQGLAAAAEFQKILDHRGVVISDPIGALAHLQIGRAFALSGDKAPARNAYEDFFTLWNGADREIGILKQARVEYAAVK